MRDRRECPECGSLFRPLDNDHTFCSMRCARLRDARHGGASERDKQARFIDEVMAAHHRIWPEEDMSKSKSGGDYLSRHRSKTSVPPDDSKLTGADKAGLQDEADAEVREGARQAIVERDRELARVHAEGLAGEQRRKHTEAVQRAHDEAAKEPTAESASRTFKNWLRKLWTGV